MSEINVQSSHHAGAALESIDQIMERLQILQDGQVYSEAALENVLIGLTLQDRSFHDSLQKLDTLEHHVRTITNEALRRELASEVVHRSPQEDPGTFRPKRNNMDSNSPQTASSSSPDALPPDPVESQVVNLSNPLPNRPIQNVTEVHYTQSALVDKLYEILSDPVLPQASTLPVERPPPLSSVVYRPNSNPRSESPDSADLAVLQSLFRRRGRRSHPSSRKLHLRDPENLRHEEFDHDRGSISSSDDVRLEQRLRQIRSMRLRRVDRGSSSMPHTLPAAVTTSTRPNYDDDRPRAAEHRDERVPVPRPRVNQDRNSMPSAGRLQPDARPSQTSIPERRAVPAEESFRQSVQHSRDISHSLPTGPPRSVDSPIQDPRSPPSTGLPLPPQDTQPGVQHLPLPPRPRSEPQYQSRQANPTMVQFPPDVINPAIELIQEVRAGQRALIDQQREAVRYIRDLNGWLERGVRDRMMQVHHVKDQLDTLQEGIRNRTAQAFL